MLRALAYNQCGWSSIPVQCHCFWFLPCPERFSPGSPVFLPLQKTTFPNFNSIREADPHESQLINVDLAFSIGIVIYLFIIPWQNAQSLTSYMSCKCFSGVSCQTIPNPKNGMAAKLGFFLQLTCNSGYFFNPYPAGLPALFRNPFYRCIDNKWVSQNDFVSILYKAPDCMSKSFV